MDDCTISASVRETLDRSTAGDFSEVVVGLHAGRAELSGQFRLHSERLAARLIVAAVPGVRSVRDLSRVKDLDCRDAPPPTSAERVVRAALRRVGLAEVGATVHGTHATLAGRVRNQDERHRAQRAVRGVPGIHFVADRTICDDATREGATGVR